MYALRHSKDYDKKVAYFLKKHPDIKRQYEKTLALLAEDPFYPSLRLHKFAVDRYSVSINMSYRIAIDFQIVNNEIVLYDIGTHKDIYGKG